jgi:hypothetical protein
MAYCGCLAATCSAFAGYPFADDAGCYAACTGFDAMEFQCWNAYCIQASEAVAGKEHLCEHAWGGEGVSEC